MIDTPRVARRAPSAGMSGIHISLCWERNFGGMTPAIV
jgi:hypothetical protein